ncbi:MAG: 1,4-dihydroxy-2-naphthoate polyprenyltransferase [Anaerolineaceae bacterium]
MTIAATTPGKRGAWKLAVRLPTLTAAVSPVLVGSGVAIHQHVFHLPAALAALLGAICLQIGANFANDVFDFKRGTDTADRLGPPRASQMGLLSTKEMLAGMWLAFALAAGAGVFLVWTAGWPLVAVGVASILAAIAYTGGPWPTGYHALGDLFTFVFFGPVAVAGTYFVQAGDISKLAWLASIPIGCTVTMILVVNNLRDIPTDRQTGKRTLGVVLGDRWTRRWFVLLAAVAGAIPLLTAVIEGAPWGVLALPIAAWWFWPPMKAVLTGAEGRALNPVLKATARFNLVFGLAWAVTLAIH